LPQECPEFKIQFAIFSLVNENTGMRNGLILLLLSVSLSSFSQKWCPPGARWYYGLESGFGYSGYIKITYTGDTLIQGKICNKLARKETGADYMTSTPYSIRWGVSYTYYDSLTSIVYILNHTHFDTLYDFAAVPGMKWTVPGSRHYGNTCDSTGLVQVDSIGQEVVNGRTLRYICVSSIDTAQDWGLNCKIYELMGPVKSYSHSYSINYQNTSYLIPVKYDPCGLMIDEGVEGANFRCYSDSLGFSYTVNAHVACDYYPTGIAELQRPKRITVYPNPAKDYVDFESTNQTHDLQLVFRDLQGRCIQQIPLESEKTRISTGDWKAGFYFYSLIQNGRVMESGKLGVMH
jgi:hypothetical protein